ncbi:phosphatidylethanolamine-binding protein [Peziza echinospora]|nr:phosphatidylethanolamine-binding protein [Peziza echinospora]
MFASLGRAAVLLSLCLSVVSGQEREAFADPFADLLDVFPPFSNFGDLTASWPSGIVLSGSVNSSTEFTPANTAGVPTFKLTPFTEGASPINPVSPGQLFTLVMIDPDAPSRETPTLKEILHALITGITFTQSNGVLTLSAGNSVAAYIGPGPPAGTGLHRYIFLLFAQPTATVDAGAFNGNSRMNFNVRTFANNNNFGAPIAGAFFRAQNAANPGAPAPVNGDGLVIDNGEPPSRSPAETRTGFLPPISYNGTLTVSAGVPGATTTTRSNGTTIKVTATLSQVNNITETGTPVITGNSGTETLEIPDLSGLGGGAAGMEREVVGKTVLASFALGVAAIAAFLL